MKSILRFAGSVAASFVMMTLTGCATSEDAQHSQHYPESSTAQAPGTTPGTMGHGSSGDQMGTMDMKAMCDMHQKMMSAKTPEERRAMMDEHMKTMSPEMVQKHMKMMQEKCK